MDPIEAVVFDWGGTLTPWHAMEFTDMWRSYATAYDPAQEDELTAALVAAERQVWLRSRDHQASGTLAELFETAGINTAADRHQMALDAYLKFWEPHTYLDPDGHALLTALKHSGITIGVLSNTLWPREFHDEVFRRDGVFDLIDGAVYSSEMPWTKPHPEAFGRALQAIGGPDPSRTVFVGDRLYDDIYGAAQLGMRTIHIPHSVIPDEQRGHTEGRPDATVQRLAEIVAVVKNWRV